MSFGVSQIDAGSRIEMGGYTECGDAQQLCKEQFSLGDIRSLDDVVRELVVDGYIPSWCTACYRVGRTGEHFMEFAIPGFIKKLCTPNALLTLQEYLVDYATPETRAAGQKLIDEELAGLEESEQKQKLTERLTKIRETDDRDMFF
jgi:2-iminoacetate synthase